MSARAGANELRVVLVAMPPLVRDIICAAIAREADIQVVAEYDAVREFIQATAQVSGVEDHALSDPDVVILCVTDEEDEAPTRLLATFPTTRVLAVAMNGKTTALYTLRPHRVALGEVSSTALVHALRRAPDLAHSWQLAG